MVRTRVVAASSAVRRRGRTPDGYTLVVLVVVVTVMTILLAAALPSWSTLAQRDREAELVFRGMQYAEAIRVFQLRFGRYPTQLKELIEIHPRCLRQLWKDPMTDSGEWGLIFAQQAQAAGNRQQQAGVALTQTEQQEANVGASGRQRQGGRDSGREEGTGAPRPGETRTTGPIVGVRSLSKEEAKRTFFGTQRYDQWQFTVNLLPAVQVLPGNGSLPRATSDWIGRPFPEGLEPQQGAAPGQAQPGQQPADPQGRRRTPRRGTG